MSMVRSENDENRVSYGMNDWEEFQLSCAAAITTNAESYRTVSAVKFQIPSGTLVSLLRCSDLRGRQLRIRQLRISRDACMHQRRNPIADVLQSCQLR